MQNEDSAAKDVESKGREVRTHRSTEHQHSIILQYMQYPPVCVCHPGNNGAWVSPRLGTISHVFAVGEVSAAATQSLHIVHASVCVVCTRQHVCWPVGLEQWRCTWSPKRTNQMSHLAEGFPRTCSYIQSMLREYDARVTPRIYVLGVGSIHKLGLTPYT